MTRDLLEITVKQTEDAHETGDDSQDDRGRRLRAEELQLAASCIS